MIWSIVECQYKGGGQGPTVDIYVETADIDEATQMIRDNKDNIEAFGEHSIQDEYMYPVSYASEEYDFHIRESLHDPFTPEYAVCSDGTVLWSKHPGV